MARVYDILNAGPRHRFTVSDRLVHNCGYGLGWRKFIGYVEGLTGIVISAEDAEAAIGTYRDTYGQVPKLWRETEQAARAAIEKPGEAFTCAGGRVSFRCTSTASWMTMTLPSGRRLRYHQPRIDADEREGWEGNRIVTFLGVNQYTKRYQRESTWGGTLVENMTQAICRDLLMLAALRCEAAGMRVVLHVHDELVCEVPIDQAEGAKDRLAALMNELPPWAAGFPLATDVKLAPRYTK